MTPHENLKNLDLKLPEASNPGGSYSSVNLRGNIAYIAIQFPIWNKEYKFQGRLGDKISTKQGYEAMELCALNVLAHIHRHVGFKNVIGLNHIDVYFQAGYNWDDSPIIANGASDLFSKILEDKGKHTRAIFGVEKLPRDFCVGLTCSFTIK